ncbi:MAG: zinc-binding dehydrogenase [Alphaproteobacteria bacterium]
MRPVVDRVFALDDGVAALEYLASGRQFGKVVLRASEWAQPARGCLSPPVAPS